MKSLPFDMTWKPKKGTSFGAKPTDTDHYKEYPRQGSHGVVTGADRVVTPRGWGYSYWYVRAKGYGFVAVLVSTSTIFGLE